MGLSTRSYYRFGAPAAHVIVVSMIKVIAFDADDTLWHNERIFTETRDRFVALLAAYHSTDWIEARLNDTEILNLRHYGYGIKSFVLSMIETAVQLTERRIQGHEINRILEYGKEMIATPVELLPHVRETVERLAGSRALMLLTKGDLFDQESKLARSGLGEYFADVRVVTEKDRQTYQTVVNQRNIEPPEFLMVGNSLKSDIIPVLETGGHAIHVPYETTWELEHVPESEARRYEYHQAATIREVPDLIARLDRDGPV
jgi:putative hydrolase of the HAD superfamily